MSKIEVNTVAPQCGTTLTLGESGDTVTLGTGASQSGFGRTGTVDWQTSIKTSTITAVNGEGYFVNTTGGEITANLPAGTAGSIVAFKDYLGTFDSNKLTISANGSQKINGDATLDLEVTTEGESITLVYADDTQGWLVVNDGNTDAGSQAQYISATGGNTVATCGDFKIHTFTGPGTFTVCSVGNAAGSNTVTYMVVAAGGGGGGSNNANISGGGGAGGYREGLGSNDSYSGSPLRNPTGLPVSATGYPITVGAGGGGGPSGAGCASRGGSGNTSVFSTITSAGGGGGGNGSSGTVPDRNGIPGGSGGGGAGGGPAPTGSPGGTGNTPPVSPPQGNDGGKGGYFSPDQNAAGGGGAGAVGQDAQPPATSGAGGAGVALSLIHI